MIRVYFTVDTESSMGGAWWNLDRRPVEAKRHVFCRIGDEDFGVPLLTRIMGQYGFRGTYFVETLSTLALGEQDTRSIFDFLLGAGQDVQLHIHPVYRLYADMLKVRKERPDAEVPGPRDLLAGFSKDQQMDLLGESIEHFTACSGQRPVAFRAGCFSGSRVMMQCLYELGILVDSSFNACYQQEISFSGEKLLLNVTQNIEGVWEIPVTVARTSLPEGNGFKFADCTSLSFSEIRNMLEAAEAAGQEHFVMVFHSFSAVKPKDERYSDMRPNRIVIRRLEKFFHYLAENPSRFRVDTMGDAARDLEELRRSSPAYAVANLGLAAAITRKAVQFVNNMYWI
jgi:hypothetical protein